MIASDEDLLATMAVGNVADFREFYERYSGRVLGLLIKMLGNSEAEDVLQETFWQVWCGASTYDPRRASPAAWLFMIARSRACDALRRQRRRSTEDVFAPPPAAPSTLEALEREETCRRVERALLQLPEEQRHAVQLAFYGGMTHNEVAAIQGVPLGTAKTRIRRAMMRLRVLLAEREKVSSS